MARRGRKRATNAKRHPSGKIVQPDRPASSRPSAWVAARVDRYGQHYCWALGRAFSSGLLGAGQEAKDRLQGAARFVRLHQLFFGGEVYTCPLDDSPRGGNVIDLTVSEWQEQGREWLRSASIAMENSGTRPYFEQLISRTHTDAGPDWLDRMLDTLRWNENLRELNAQLRKIGKPVLEHKRFDPRDAMILDAAIRALDIVAPPSRPLGILVARY